MKVGEALCLPLSWIFWRDLQRDKMFLSSSWKVTLAELGGLYIFSDSSGGVSDELFNRSSNRVDRFTKDMVWIYKRKVFGNNSLFIRNIVYFIKKI